MMTPLTQGRKPYMIQFTVTQQKIIDILKDGLAHTRVELRDAVDSEATFGNMQDHVSMIRKKIRPIGQDIICELANRRICYRHVRLLGSANK